MRTEDITPGMYVALRTECLGTKTAQVVRIGPCGTYKCGAGIDCITLWIRSPYTGVKSVIYRRSGELSPLMRIGPADERYVEELL